MKRASPHFSKNRLLIIVLLIFVVIYVGIRLYIVNVYNRANIENINIDSSYINISSNLGQVPNRVVNILLVGADNLDRENGRENSYVEQRSDVFKIISLDYTDKLIKITSLDRDVVVWIPDRDAYGRFNWAYSFGGGEYAINCVNYNLDLDIKEFVAFSFMGFRRVIDKIGGIDINLSLDEAKELNMSSNNRVKLIEGINHLDGLLALNYARIRHLDSDFVRMDRQNIVIKAVIDKFKDASIFTILDAIDDCLPYITTNIEIDKIDDYLFDVVEFDLDDIKLQTYPINKQDDVCINKNELGGYILRSYSNQVIDLHKFIYDIDEYKPSNTIYDNETNIYDIYGDFYEGSKLIP